eukprot:721385-Pleurochrysis_carterae.AAC.1
MKVLYMPALVVASVFIFLVVGPLLEEVRDAPHACSSASLPLCAPHTGHSPARSRARASARSRTNTLAP